MLDDRFRGLIAHGPVIRQATIIKTICAIRVAAAAASVKDTRFKLFRPHKTRTPSKYKIEFRNHQYFDLQGVKGKFDDGESIVLAFRPEIMTIRYQDQKDTLIGEIIRKRFSGGYIRYEVKLLTDDIIIVDSQTPLKEKEKLYIQLDPQKARLFTAPEYGLKKVLSLE